MTTYSKQSEFDMMKMWLEGKESNGILQALEEKYDTSYYVALHKNDNTNIILRNITNYKVVRHNRIEIKTTNTFFIDNI